MLHGHTLLMQRNPSLTKQFALLPGLQNHEIELASVPDSWASNACCLVASLLLILYLSPA